MVQGNGLPHWIFLLDIQTAGQTPWSDPKGKIGGIHYDQDWSNDDLEYNQPNYVYLRAKCSAAANMETRLFCIPSQILNYPSLYAKYSVMDVDADDKPYTAIRQLSSNSPDILVTDSPFNVFSPADPGEGGHYCLIAEARRSGSDDDWPHQDVPTGADLANWVLNNPNVCQRNVYWSDYSSNDQLSWQTGLALPDSE